MRFRSCVALWGLAVLLSGSLAAVPKASGQDNSTETTKRKVRTRTAPDYPPLARRLKVTGKVKIEATIAADGHVTTTRVIGGSPVLVSSAVEALKKWRFEPAAKDTTEIIEFEFSGQAN
jgi:protein TonB